ncbi:MAG: esterase [Opitutae bacterium]|nr:esterase [Opitutae bacterium]
MRWPTGFILAALTFAVAPHALAREPIRRTWEVAGVNRQAEIWLPEQKSTNGAPVVFLFHGHGGNARQIARSMPIPQLWPEALVVCMQGLPTPGQLTDREGKLNGWQAAPGDQGDRDLAFFDAVLTTLRRDYPIDARRIHATGHSNGGGFTYLLWAMRRDVFAAFAPSSAVAGRFAHRLTPAPVLHLAGRNDELVKFAWQERMIAHLRELNSCAATGTREGGYVTRYASASGNPTATFIHNGGHQLPAAASAAVVEFLRAQARTE